LEKEKQKRFEKLRNKYRLVILNDETFEEKLSFRLSRLNVFSVVGASVLFLIIFVSVIIAFTPIREFIPGYTDVNLRKNVIKLTLKADSLEKALAVKDQYISNLNNIIQGKPIIKAEEVVKDSTNNYKNITDKITKEDSLLRANIEEEEKYNLIFSNPVVNIGSIKSYSFFTPLKGKITNTFDPENLHFGVDIVAPQNEAIKATLDGRVIFAEWTSETGYVIEIQHSGNLVSVYKHNSVLLKKQGDYVQAGEVIAIIGNSGELSSGPHLHFELWYNGQAINPQEYMFFE
jgi:murein DD-endopeptidase MepM/ murein hydrolase activator NlpD